MPAKRAPRRRTPVQQDLDLALDGMYLNHIDPPEMLRHLAVGGDDEHAAAKMIERCIDHALEEQAYAHEAAMNDLKEVHSSALYAAHEELDDALSEYTFERLTQEEFLARVHRLNATLLVMHNKEDFSLKDAFEKLDAADAKQAANPKRVARKARVPR